MDINFYEKVVKLGFLCGDKFLYGIGGLHGGKRKRALYIDWLGKQEAVRMMMV